MTQEKYEPKVHERAKALFVKDSGSTELELGRVYAPNARLDAKREVSGRRVVELTPESEGVFTEGANWYYWTGLVCDEPIDVVFAPGMRVRLGKLSVVYTKGGTVYTEEGHVWEKYEIAWEGGRVYG